jgi:late competence protein required for DNA uptake (superfamily II DNA/RNA helicase)
MSLSIESVMADLAPMLASSESCRCARCGDTDPDNFGVCKTRCLSCRRDDDIARKLREKQAREYSPVPERCKAINSFPPTEGANRCSQ